MGFKGEYSHSIDDKGRLIMPAKFREQIGERFVVTKGLDSCLYAYSESEWALIEEKFREIPLTTEKARKFTRFFFSSAEDMSMDKQGRYLIPQNMRDFAGITGEVVTAGALTRLEIWDKDKWQNANSYDDVSEIAEYMAELGLRI